jgi:hypothetical protein
LYAHMNKKTKKKKKKLSRIVICLGMHIHTAWVCHWHVSI